MAYLIEVLFHISVSSSAIVLNLLLLFATLKPAQKANRSYTILMRIQTIADLTAAVSILATLQRTIPCEWSFILISYGPCSLLGGSACLYFYVLMISAYTVSFTNVLVCMGARYWFLRCGSIERRKMFVTWLLCSGVPGIALFLRTALTRIDDSEAERILHRHFNYPTEYLVVTGTSSMQTTVEFIASCFIFFSPFPVMMCIWIYRARMLSLLEEKKRKMTSNTRLLHRQFVASLTLQALLPSFTLLSITLLFIGFNNIYNGPLLEMMVVISNELPAFFSPIIVITHIHTPNIFS